MNCKRVDSPSADETVTALAHWIIQQRQSAVAAKGSFHLVLAGGNTPRQLYAYLAAHTQPEDWHHTHVYWGDERCVPPEHPDSNYGMAWQTWLHTWPIERLHRLQGEVQPVTEAQHYEQVLRKHLLKGSFDVVLLGLGTDGHTASLFPVFSELRDTNAWCAATQHPTTGQPRLTLTPAVLNHAQHVAFLVTGTDKTGIIEAVFDRQADYPANWIQPLSGQRWLFTEKHSTFGKP